MKRGLNTAKEALHSPAGQKISQKVRKQIKKKALDAIQRTLDGESPKEVLKDEAKKTKKELTKIAKNITTDSLAVAQTALGQTVNDLKKGVSPKKIAKKQSKNVQKAMKRKLYNLLEDNNGNGPKQPKKSLLDD